MKSLTLLFIIVALLCVQSTQAFWMSRVFSDNMVLQRGPQQAQLYGYGVPYDTITIMLDSTKYQTYVTNEGEWFYSLPAMEASTGHQLTVSGSDGKSSFTNVAFGDVYICSGQSNMEFTLNGVFNANEEIEDAGNYPDLRFFTVTRNSSLTPVVETQTRFDDGSNWVVSSPTYVNGTMWNYMSAVCYLFGRDLYVSQQGKVPIGLLETCWGGTRIEAWTSPAGLETCGPVSVAEDHTMKTYSVDEQFSGIDGPDPQTPSVLFNGMIYSFLNLRLTGVVWYQAEQNSANATNYACRFPAMITDWRQQFNNFELYFGFVVVAAYKEGGFPTWPLLREAQLKGLELPYVGAATAQDLGDEASPEGAIHPRNKSQVGYRLSLFMQNQVYGDHVLYKGPEYTDIIWPVNSASTQSVILRFDPNLPNNQKLGLRDTSECTACCANIAGSAMTVTLNTGEILRTEVVVDSAAYLVIATADVSKYPGSYITYAQMNYDAYPECSLYNDVLLPHLPFNISRF